MALTNQVLMPGADYQAICNKVRELTGGTAPLKSGDIVTALSGVLPGGGGEQPQLLAPTISVTEDLLTITPNPANGGFVSGWRGYAAVGDGDFTLFGTLPADTLTLDLTQQGLPAAAYRFKATAIGDNFVESDASNVVAYTNVFYAVTKTLSNCSIDHAGETVRAGAFAATLTPAVGYTMSGATVTVTMGGEDITATAYSNGAISIAQVTGDIVITAAAALRSDIAWTAVAFPTLYPRLSSLSTPCVMGNKIYVVDSKGYGDTDPFRLFSSVDGINWDHINIPASYTVAGEPIFAIATNGTAICGISGRNTGEYAYVVKGIYDAANDTWSWKRIKLKSWADPKTIISGSIMYITGDKVYFDTGSSDFAGSASNISRAYGLYGGVANGKTFLFKSGESTFYVPDDGMLHWTQKTADVNFPVLANDRAQYSNNNVCYANGIYVVKGSGTSCVYSYDGETWASAGTEDASKPLYNVAYFDGRFVSQYGKIFAYSDDGINWTISEGDVAINGFAIIGNTIVATYYGKIYYYAIS